jgi:hypothetical protein
VVGSSNLSGVTTATFNAKHRHLAGVFLEDCDAFAISVRCGLTHFEIGRRVAGDRRHADGHLIVTTPGRDQGAQAFL